MGEPLGLPIECLFLISGTQRRKIMIIKQIETGYMDNFCYIVGCEVTRKALVLDPGADVDRILSEAKKEELKIVTIVNTQ